MRQRICLMFLVAALSFSGPVQTAEIGVKSLSGPPTEFAAHRLPSAGETAVPSSILLIDRSTPNSKGTTFLSFSTSPRVGFSLVQVTTLYPYFASATITAPDGSRYQFDGSTITCDFGYCGELQADLRMEAFTTQAPGGTAILSVSGGEVAGGTWNVALQDPTPPLALVSSPPQIESLISFADNVVEVEIDPVPCLPTVAICPFTLGQRRNETFDLMDGAAPVLRLSFVTQEMKRKGIERGIELAALGITVTNTRTRRTFHQEQLSFSRLAGLHVDGSGASLVQLPNLPAGEYSVRLDIKGNVKGIGPIERTALYFLPITARRYEVTGEIQTEVIDDERLKLLLEVKALTMARKHVYAYAEVWTGDGKTPIAWVGGMTQPEMSRSGQLGMALVLDTRWLALAGASGSEYLLRNVRLHDADTFIPIDEIAELPFTVGDLPLAASLAPAEVVKDDSLYIGKGNRTISTDEAEAGSALQGNFSRTGIFLVHGWCSETVWPLGHFGRPGRVGGTEIFADFNASRSHDDFAQKIRAQGTANFSESFTVVAHSQGGAAATHLRSFYSSLLDNSTAPRRIQTMGTPYAGSILMDYYLATGSLGWLIANIFGQCTPQFDLGTLGSALWRSNIPIWARSDVYYYRTIHQRARTVSDILRFWLWRCDLSSFVIPFWDDGVVADLQGFLPGAHDMGITEGECHTDGMNYSAQTRNNNRNDIMDREGRPPPVNQARFASASASSTFTPGCSPGPNCYFPSRVNDGDRSTTLGGNTSWANDQGQPLPQWVQLHWPSAITFSRVNLYLTSGYEISSFRIEYRSSAGAPWQVLATVTGNTSATLGPYNALLPGTATAQDIRVLGLLGPAIQPGYIRVNELEVY